MNGPTISIIGLGYIGLPTAVALCNSGATVYGVDLNPSIVDSVNKGVAPFVEPDLESALAKAHSCGRLTASNEVHSAEAFIIAVPTPFTADRQPDLSYVRAATESLAPLLAANSLVILESTSPPGTTTQIAQWLTELRPDLVAEGQLEVGLAYCPERVLPGRIMVELVTNDRVIGGITPQAANRAAAIYGLFCTGDLLQTDATTAEMVKLVENSFRDVNIAFANELSLICETVGVDVWELIRLANHHPRVNILQPGPGVGGHCIAVDPWFIVAADPLNSPLIRTAREVNDKKPGRVIARTLDAVASLPNPVIAALGLAFKPDIDDLRESPARAIVASLALAQPEAKIKVVEPHITELPDDLAAHQNVALTDLATAVCDADCVLLLVNHSAFASKPELPQTATLIDTRGSWT